MLCDEDIGTGVPKALTLVGYDARSIVGCGWQGRPDEWWLTQAGRLDWLVLSCDKRMMLVPSERDVIKSERVGIVYHTKGHICKCKYFGQYGMPFSLSQLRVIYPGTGSSRYWTSRHNARWILSTHSHLTY